MSNRRFIGLLVSFCVIADLIISVLDRVQPDDLAGSLVAFAVSQISMLAVWSGLGTQNPLVRFGIGLPVACLVSSTIMGPMGGDANEIAIMLLGVWILLVTILSTVRIFGGWRFTFPHANEVRSQDDIRSERQFRIRQMFGVTTIIAVVLALVRVLVGHANLGAAQLYLFAILGLFISVGAVVVIWALLCDTWLVWWIVAALFTVVWTTGEVVLFSEMTSGRVNTVIIMLNFSQFLALSFGMACLRFCGGRLRRVGEATSREEL